MKNNIISIGTVGKIKINKKLQRQIDFLHSILHGKEWSGILVYKQTKGFIKNMKNLVFDATDFFLMDIGTSSSTEFDYDTDIVSMYDHLEYAMEASTGLLHSHHNMGAYHSDIDMQELGANSKQYNYYISLVVDTSSTYKCKIGFPSKTTITYNNIIKDNNGKDVSIDHNVDQDVILLGDLDVITLRDINVDKWFVDRFEKIKHKPIKQYTFETQLNLFEHPNNTLQSFLIALLCVDSTCSKNLDEAFKSLNALSDDDFHIYCDMLDSNISILHFNIYGTKYLNVIENNIMKVIDLVNQLHNTHTKNEKKFINLLTDWTL